MEMSYLENTESDKEITQNPASQIETPRLARKSILEDKDIPELDSVFDSVNTKLASPDKSSNTKEEKPKRAATGTITKDAFESLIE
jgi:hypothetical protein